MIATITAAALSVVTSILVYVVQNLMRENDRLRNERKQAEEKRQKAIGDGVLSLLRIQLIEYHDKYMKQETIPAYAYENWDEMFSAYEALGGNGTIKKMNDDVERLRLGR